MRSTASSNGSPNIGGIDDEESEEAERVILKEANDQEVFYLHHLRLLQLMETDSYSSFFLF